MATLELKAYEILKSKFGIEEAETVIEYIETKVEKNVERSVKSLATKEDVMTAKSDLRVEMANLRTELKIEIANVKSEMLRAIYIVGLVQFLAIVGSVVAIINFISK